MTTQFRKGDNVKCIKTNIHTEITVNKVYEITALEGENIILRNDRGLAVLCSPSLFELVNDNLTSNVSEPKANVVRKGQTLEDYQLAILCDVLDEIIENKQADMKLLYGAIDMTTFTNKYLIIQNICEIRNILNRVYKNDEPTINIHYGDGDA